MGVAVAAVRCRSGVAFRTCYRWADVAGVGVPAASPFLALQCAIAERRQREVLSDAVPASAGEGARVVAVRPLGGDEFEAEIIGPAGVPHADLVASLQATLAESVLSLSGRRLAHVSVVGTGSKGSVLVRCSTASPYGRTVRLEDL